MCNKWEIKMSATLINYLTIKKLTTNNMTIKKAENLGKMNSGKAKNIRSQY